jgi:hypothetical protein
MTQKPFETAEDGQPVFAALVKPLKTGGVSVTVMVEDGGGDDDKYIHAEWHDEKSILLATRLEAVVGKWA